MKQLSSNGLRKEKKIPESSSLKKISDLLKIIIMWTPIFIAIASLGIVCYILEKPLRLLNKLIEKIKSNKDER